MSHIPSSAMKHAHTAPAPHDEPSPAKRVTNAVEHVPTPVWVSVAAGVAGAVATALFLSLRSSAPAPKPAARRKPAARKPKSA